MTGIQCIVDSMKEPERFRRNLKISSKHESFCMIYSVSLNVSELNNSFALIVEKRSYLKAFGFKSQTTILG